MSASVTDLDGGVRQQTLPVLPPDVARMIFGQLNMKDLCSVAETSWDFWNYTCHVTRLIGTFPLDRADYLESFNAFLSKRLLQGMQVETIINNRRHHSRIFDLLNAFT